jgi:hypothetical protein
MADQGRAHDVRDDDAVESLEVRAIAVERLTFFADAVIAIAITLLALVHLLRTGTGHRRPDVHADAPGAPPARLVTCRHTADHDHGRRLAHRRHRGGVPDLDTVQLRQ